MKITKFDKYQKIAMSTLYHVFLSDSSKRRQLEYGVLALCGESGELANKLKKLIHYGDGAITKEVLIDELSDVLWYVACIADALNVELSEVATLSVNKVLMKEATKAEADTTEEIIEKVVKSITEQIKEGAEIAKEEANQNKS